MIVDSVLEQHAIFEGDKPWFTDGFLVLTVLNHKSIGGGTLKDLAERKAEGTYDDPRLYKVRITVAYEEIKPAE